SRQGAKQPLRMFVAAVLRPHQREDGQLHVVRLAPEAIADELVLGVGQAELAVPSVGRRPHGAHAATAAEARASDSKMRPPSTDPVSGSTACSGCGISPITLPASLVTPAMSRSAPLKFSPGA